MNIATKLMASLVASVVLTACSGGSSSSSAQPKTEPTPKTNMPAPKAEQPKKEEGPQADSPKVEEPKERAPQVGNPKVEEPKEMVPQIGNPKSNDPQVMIPKMDMPQKDDLKREDLNKDKSNAEILHELRIEDIKVGIITRPDVVLNLVLDEKENIQIRLNESDIERHNLKITNTIPTQDIKTLKDSSGKLLGYYGYMQLNQVRQDENYSLDSVNLDNHYLLSMNEADKKQPTTSLVYKGSMFYGADSKSEAEVNAQYDNSNKKLFMEVIDSNNYWKLGEFLGSNKLPKDRISGVVVNQDGTIENARLYAQVDGEPLKFIPDANFSGGLFGKNGEVLAGKAEGINNNWQGVIGATATEANKK
ncbi:transferrin-binding protein-like solute binding protein [Actinobacillus genomosp. 1]|uniref:transferrin-binding protein-like solute binding protein n=1 Tax=Actinobacillus genomosp. 1 TaxID=254839 RepID=UPI00244289EE|nr:transferrin-binding protein-like solute binding protein [Actinobacillus genomosp. 1]WGE35740.1 transferrin-binding protein-like solute binding protein [Actinobacillus genomosp. 1]